MLGVLRAKVNTCMECESTKGAHLHGKQVNLVPELKSKGKVFTPIHNIATVHSIGQNRSSQHTV